MDYFVDSFLGAWTLRIAGRGYARSLLFFTFLEKLEAFFQLVGGYAHLKLGPIFRHVTNLYSR